MIEVTAKYLGRKKYEITISKGENKEKHMYYEPLFKDPSKCTSRIVSVSEELNIKDIDVSIEDLWLALSLAADMAGRKFPKLRY